MKRILITFSFILLFGNMYAQVKYDPLKILRKKFSLFVYTPNKLFMEKGSVILSKSDKYDLTVVANALHHNKELKLQIETYYDATLDPEASKIITQKRAEAIKNYLIICGVNSDNLVIKAYGDTILVNRCKYFVKCTEAEHAANRRVKLRILNPEKLEDYKIVKNNNYL